MKTSGTGRVLAGVLIGTIGGVYINFGESHMLSMGKQAFLITQERRFDRVAAHHSGPAAVIAGLILAALAFGVYELIAAGFTRLIPPSEVEE
jgi:hypothetical protein